jgi:superfamily II DNA/RNA helicase
VVLAAEPTDTFSALGLSPTTLDTLTSLGFERPFRIQALTIPDALAGRDVCGKAQTGSGKTLAFGLPLVDLLTRALPKHPVALVLVPTRELCAQVSSALEPFVAAHGFRLVSVYGGTSTQAQVTALKEGVEMVVATPGRLIDLMDRRVAVLDAVKTVVIDEADEMADMGFLPQVQHILRRVGAGHRTMLFSATLDHRVQTIVRAYMHDPVYHEAVTTTITVEESVHRFVGAHHMDKPKIVARIAASARRTLVFVRTKRACDWVFHDLRELGVAVRAIHGDIPQPKREQALKQFTDGKVAVLVATNVAARGLHVEGVDVVVHYDPPEDSRTYLHRSGRTARAGEAGLVVTLVEWNQEDEVRRIQREAGLNEPIVKMFSNDPRLDDLTGWEAPAEETPAPVSAPKRQSARARRRSRLL